MGWAVTFGDHRPPRGLLKGRLKEFSVHQAVTAVSESNRMARVVALVHDTPTLHGLLAGICPPAASRKKGNTQAFVLAIAPPGTLT